jgi:hypothetical protein
VIMKNDHERNGSHRDGPRGQTDRGTTLGSSSASGIGRAAGTS